MDIVFFVHPNFLDSQSMPRFATMLINGMKQRGHHVEVLSPKPFLFGLLGKSRWNKWLGYIDQYIIFPRQVKKLLDNKSKNKLYVFSDQALGPWVPIVAGYPHVIHCHDFLALRSALGEFPENKSGWTGKQYQAFIRRGFNKGNNFISVSNNTRKELHRFLTSPFLVSTVVYNGLNQTFSPGNVEESRNLLGRQIGINLTDGYLLHVGGNQWYKNRKGVIELYESWCSLNKNTLPLLMIGKKPDKELLNTWNQLKNKANIHWLTEMNDEQIKQAYRGAIVFLFPSLSEGFGWPIAEAMASGCPVITTNEAPMTEVAGNAGFFINRKPFGIENAKAWAIESAKIINEVINLSTEQRQKVVSEGIVNAARFNTDVALDSMEALYKKILQSYSA